VKLKIKLFYYKMIDVMIDIETLGINPDSVVLTIGAIKFRKDEDLKSLDSYETFYVKIDQNSCTEIGCKVDPKTVDWWNKQSVESRYEAIESDDRITIREALIKLSKWLKGDNIIWANSPSFDCVILENVYKKCKLDIPWKFWLIRDCRTLFDLTGITKNDLPNNHQHHALYDCYSQLTGVIKGYKKIKIL